MRVVHLGWDETFGDGGEAGVGAEDSAEGVMLGSDVDCVEGVRLGNNVDVEVDMKVDAEVEDVGLEVEVYGGGGWAGGPPVLSALRTTCS